MKTLPQNITLKNVCHGVRSGIYEIKGDHFEPIPDVLKAWGDDSLEACERLCSHCAAQVFCRPKFRLPVIQPKIPV